MNPTDLTTEQLRPYASEYLRRIRLGKTAKPKVLRPCPKGCGLSLGARELRKHIPTCQARESKQ